MSAAELAAARAERAARFAAQQASAPPPPPPAPPPPAAEEGAGCTEEAAVPRDYDDATLDALASDVLRCIELSGERDRQGTHPHTEVDCRLWETSFRPVASGSRVFTLHQGEGRLADRRAETAVDRERNVRFLTESARLIHQARARGEHVWVHCTEVRAPGLGLRASPRLTRALFRASTADRRGCWRICCCTRAWPACGTPTTS